MTPRAAKVRDAVRAIVARGEKPSSGRVQAELGEFRSNNLNGRDSAVYAAEMELAGYVRARIIDPRSRYSYGVNRWVKPDEVDGSHVIAIAQADPDQRLPRLVFG